MQEKVRKKHLRVPVFADEEAQIEALAKQSGKSVASYLRAVGQGYEVKGVVDYEQVRELSRINGDLGRIGGLLKLWLTNDERTLGFGPDTIRAVLAKIEKTQDEMAQVMMRVVMPTARDKELSQDEKTLAAKKGQS